MKIQKKLKRSDNRWNEKIKKQKILNWKKKRKKELIY